MKSLWVCERLDATEYPPKTGASFYDLVVDPDVGRGDAGEALSCEEADGFQPVGQQAQRGGEDERRDCRQRAAPALVQRATDVHTCKPGNS